MLTPEERTRIEVLERKVALLRGEPDPGISCKGASSSDCCGGRVKVYGTNESWSWGTCPTCGGTGRMFSPL
jgi:hypothetical protein